MKATLERISVIFTKEIRDNLRDRRSLFSALSSSLIGPVLIVAMIMVLGKTIFTEQIEKTLVLPVEGAQHAASLIRFLEQNNIEIRPAPPNPQEAVRNGDVNLVLIIPATYAPDFSAGLPANVQLVIDSSRQSALPDIERVRAILGAYEQQIANNRLLLRGVSPMVINPLDVERMDVATPQSQVLIFLNMMPYFIILVIFVGGMYVIIDATAGERERGSLEPLLINPAQRWEFVLGKLAAATPFAVFSVFVTLLAFAVAFNAIPLEDYVGIQLTIDPAALIGIFLISLPMILLASSLQMIVASFTHSFKEAQTYVAFLPLIPALPGILLAFLPVKPSLWTMMIPTFGQQLLINQLMRGEPLSPANVVVSTLVTLIAVAILTCIAIYLYSKERIILGNR